MGGKERRGDVVQRQRQQREVERSERNAYLPGGEGEKVPALLFHLRSLVTDFGDRHRDIHQDIHQKMCAYVRRTAALFKVSTFRSMLFRVEPASDFPIHGISATQPPSKRPCTRLSNQSHHLPPSHMRTSRLHEVCEYRADTTRESRTPTPSTPRSQSMCESPPPRP